MQQPADATQPAPPTPPAADGGPTTPGTVALVAGESLVDVVRRPDGTVEERAGGSAANVAVALVRLGRPTWFATALADDRLGGILAAHLGRDGVRLAADPEVVGRTSSAVATIDADGAASYEFDLEWRLGAVHVPEGEPGWLHVCSIGAVLPPGAADVLDLARRERRRALVSYDVNARPAITGTGPEMVAQVEAVVAEADVVKASDEDLAALWPDLDEAAAVARLRALGPTLVVVTRGAAGASCHHPGGEVAVPAVRDLVVVDTIGAGDTLAAAFISALWDLGVVGAGARDRLAGLGEDALRGALGYAARAAAVTVSRPGADPPYLAEVAGAAGS
ncbi:carbohydrate kinase [Nocardioides sp. ChNu-153]|uniref:PfkB family carbohydrate kinase n=1 Tax=unclassified Nocardioides TaxID=2615069 RepID=UPI002406484B|nr:MULTISPECIES: PfkB family carbohydrate kinase [unclassified Nocardioides]MDF9717843.1 carbohydrate kinase [Nocardioides sp. ChNu-99]MDN7121423.1 carbohydrate kinase [Nocardioides sp. ChNu-153]